MDRLSDADALMWRIEEDPVLRSPILVLATLDRVPEWEAVLEALDQVARNEVPRLRQRVEVVGPGTARLRWVDDPDFAVEHHVRRVQHRGATGSTGVRAALDEAQPDVMAAFDPARPPWQLTVLTGIGGGRAALVLRFHHAISDGVGAVQLAELLFDRTRSGGDPTRAAADSPGVAEPAVAPSPPAALAALNGAVHAVDGTLRMGAGALRHPFGAAHDVVKTARSIAHLVGPPGGSPSPLFVGRGIERSIDVLEVPLPAMLAARERYGVTLNDVFLAAVGGGLRAYHRSFGVDLAQVRVTMPVSTRRSGDARGGNRFQPSRYVLPIDDPDPGVRALVAHNLVRRNRAEPALHLGAPIAAALNALPRHTVTRLFGSLLRGIDVDAVDVPGLRRDAYLAGAKVERLWAFAPPVGAALSVTLVSHLDTCCIGVSCDRAAVRDPDLLTRCLEASLAEVIGGQPTDADGPTVVLAGAAP